MLLCKQLTVPCAWYVNDHLHYYQITSQSCNTRCPDTDPSPQELLAITDSHVNNTLRAQDASQGKWLAEDPSLTQIQQMLMSR